MSSKQGSDTNGEETKIRYVQNRDPVSLEQGSDKSEPRSWKVRNKVPASTEQGSDMFGTMFQTSPKQSSKQERNDHPISQNRGPG